MAPLEVSSYYEQPISRTYQYRKVMKPMLERKRRARINRCLDELKDLMVTALCTDGENVSKLEKADILELTVRHLHRLERQQRLSGNPIIEVDRFRSGFTHCATEVSQCLASFPGVDISIGTKLMTHLGNTLNQLTKTAVQPTNPSTSTLSPPAAILSPPASILSPPASPIQYSPVSSINTPRPTSAPLTPLSIDNDFCNDKCLCSSCFMKPEDRLLKIVSFSHLESSQDLWRPW